MGLPSHKSCQAPSDSAGVYVRHRPETTLLYQIIQEYWPELQAELASHGKYLPAYVIKEFDEYLKCGRLEHGFLRVRCEPCHDEKLVAFSCKKRGFCPSCGARRMADSAALLVDEILPYQPMRQWVLSVPFPLRFLFAGNAKAMTGVLGIVYRIIATHLAHKAGFTKPLVQTGRSEDTQNLIRPLHVILVGVLSFSWESCLFVSCLFLSFSAGYYFVLIAQSWLLCTPFESTDWS